MQGFKERGLGVAALSYDPVAVLKEFADRRHITFPLLSDPGSEIIKRYGLFNDFDYPVGHAFRGVPYPGTFITDAQGIIRVKDFKETYQERNTAASRLILEGGAGDASVNQIQNDQFSLRTSASNADGAVGNRITLALDFKMGEHMHAYAQGVTGYRPLKLTMDENPLFTAHEVIYPESTLYTFEPLNETVPVYEGEFRVLQDITVNAPPRDAPVPPTQIDVKGTLSYQVCSDTLCYAPSTLPLQWTIKLIPLDRERSPEELRQKPPTS